jgi:hypothetical protein
MARTTGREYGLLFHQNAKLRTLDLEHMIEDLTGELEGRGVKKSVVKVKRTVTKKKAAAPAENPSDL